ncbi:MAG: hypothetical protein NT031_04280, partial [Planctomycetota bacterium]|nr:hypothetical protein [Planctomycetota bacterium]
MKRFAVVCAVLAVAGVFCLTAVADRTSSAVGKVLVVVDPNVKVAIAADPSPVNWQTGDVSVNLTFQVDANQQFVTLYVEASDLFKGDDPTGTSVAPI